MQDPILKIFSILTVHSREVDSRRYGDASSDRNNKKSGRTIDRCHFHGADNGIRTRDPHLGKVMLYQLSHVRIFGFQKLEATPGFEPGVKALQASALPLGHVAILASCLIKSWLVTQPAHLRQWSGQRDSNPRPSPWQGDALPAEPCPHREEV